MWKPVINRILLQILLDTKSQADSNPNLPIRDLIAADNKIKSNLFVRPEPSQDCGTIVIQSGM